VLAGRARAAPATRMLAANALIVFIVRAILSSTVVRTQNVGSRAHVEVRAYQLGSTTYF
jgi:hypothetical protein